jgi:hypothetical protein
MKPRNPWIFAALLAIVAVAIVVAVPTASARDSASARPPHNVYTCNWIAHHPIAARRALVTCRARPPVVLPAAITQLTTFTPFTATAQGCTFVPLNGGYIGNGVFAWTNYEYSNYWNWSPQKGSPPSDYTWYLQNTNGVNYAYHRETDSGLHAINTTANNRRWGVQNHRAVAGNWYACYAVH